MYNKILFRLYDFISLGRYDRPAGGILLFIPSLLSYATHYKDSFPIRYVMLCFIGSLVARGAGCTINDILDRKIDARVERTKNRPIASGKISIVSAVFFLIFQGIVCLIILMQFPHRAIIFGLITIPFVMIYPLMKRLTNWPQLFLGFTFSMPIVFASLSLDGRPNHITFILFIMHTIWVTAYDTIYAHQDKYDDQLIGIGSSALALKKQSRSFIFVSYIFVYIMFLFLGILGGYDSKLFYILSFFVLLSLLKQAILTNFDDRSQCMGAFLENQYIGVIMAGIVIISKWG